MPAIAKLLDFSVDLSANFASDFANWIDAERKFFREEILYQKLMLDDKDYHLAIFLNLNFRPGAKIQNSPKQNKLSAAAKI